MRWRVEVSECSGDDRLLRDVLRKVSFVLHEQAGQRFLISDKFEALASAGEVHALASRAQSILAETSRVPISFRIGYVFEESPNGEVQTHMITSAVLIAQSAGMFALAGQGAAVMVDPYLTEAEQKRIEEERAYQASLRDVCMRFVPAFNDTRALEVQRLLRRELNADTMWKIFEIIRSDRRDSQNLITRSERSRFAAINRSDVLGNDARHVVTKGKRPNNPMSIEEARGYICRLAEHWLERKAGI